MQGNGMMLITSDALELVERFTPIGADVLQYEVTVNDPKTWTAPWKVSFPLKRECDYQFFEYACHEGNNSMRNILSGSRADERAAAGGEVACPDSRGGSCCGRRVAPLRRSR